MFRNMSGWTSALGCAVVLALTSSATAQYYGGSGYDACCNPCVQVQPVAQSCYQTVPVTEYRQVKQVVQRPKVETQYVDRQVTEYRPVTEQKTAEIPTVTYTPVTEYQTVTRDMGYWTTHQVCNQRVAPCQYDPRPGLLGWFNRTGYAFRQSFTPRVRTVRQYVPRVVAQQVPVTRQVAQHGTRQVTYNVTRMVAHTTTKKVAVNTVRYVAEEITTSQPVTVMRTVPIGTSVAYINTPYGVATALGPSPDPVSASRTADSRTYDGTTEPKKFKRGASARPFEDDFGPNPETAIPRKDTTNYRVNDDQQVSLRKADNDGFVEILPRRQSASRLPSVVQAGGWATPRTAAAPRSTGPALSGQGIPVVSSSR